ncbi:uncharacterized protein LOC135333480 [Halichondria panicea]|uniref:uncharacterized protein LOC135333480 n=1 Tax=Halichondria panicea TaxID=6063 RepID=UPI00312B4BC3
MYRTSGLTHTLSGHKPPKATQKLSSTNSNVGIQELKSRERTTHQKPVVIVPKIDHTVHKQLKSSTGPVRTRSKRTRQSPYTTRHSEVTRMRKVSSCSEGKDPVVID